MIQSNLPELLLFQVSLLVFVFKQKVGRTIIVKQLTEELMIYESVNESYEIEDNNFLFNFGKFERFLEETTKRIESCGRLVRQQPQLIRL